MKTFAKIVTIVVCAAAVTLPAMAQEKRSSISAFGNYSKFAKDKDASGNANVAYGYMVSPQLELGVQLLQTFGATSMTGIGGLGQYYLNPVGKPNQINPYAKIDALSLTGTGYDATQTGLYVGIGYAATESTEVFVEVGGESKSTKFSGFKTDDNGTVVNFGLKLRF